MTEERKLTRPLGRGLVELRADWLIFLAEFQFRDLVPWRLEASVSGRQTGGGRGGGGESAAKNRPTKLEAPGHGLVIVHSRA